LVRSGGEPRERRGEFHFILLYSKQNMLFNDRTHRSVQRFSARRFWLEVLTLERIALCHFIGPLRP